MRRELKLGEKRNKIVKIYVIVNIENLNMIMVRWNIKWLLEKWGWEIII